MQGFVIYSHTKWTMNEKICKASLNLLMCDLME